jgi:putative FmdB family regulatory protein
VPTYQYACAACGHQLEAVQAFTDEPLTVCPECGGQLRKVFSAVGVVFKGSGFYRNDSRASATSSDGAAKNAKSSESAGSDSSSTSSGSGSSGSSDKSAKGGESTKSGSGSTKKSSDGSSSKVA